MTVGAASVWVVGTFDTKAQELQYIAQIMRQAGRRVTTVDIGTSGNSAGLGADLSAGDVAAYHPDGAQAVFGAADRGGAVMAMEKAFTQCVRSAAAEKKLSGMLGVGGSGGTTMIAPAMHQLPIGLPKLLVSTMASGDVAPLVDVYDIMMLYPVTDIAGLNSLSRTILRNAALAMTGMVQQESAVAVIKEDKPALGLSMFGVTTPCVQAVRARLQDEFDCLVCHANGAGGRTLEALASAGMLQAVVDVTTTEIGQHLAGGLCDAGPDRLAAAAQLGLAWIGSLGALDMVNWGPVDTIPAAHAGRLFQVHNARFTLMRTNAGEMHAAGRVIAQRLNRSPGPVALLVPLLGLSALDAPGQPFHDPQANEALFDALRTYFVPGQTHTMQFLPLHINDDAFAEAISRTVRQTLGH